MVRRRAPCSFSASPPSHCASLISNRSTCGTAPAMLSKASIRPNAASASSTTLCAAAGWPRSASMTSICAPAAFICAPAAFTASAVSSRLARLRATRTSAEKSRARRTEVARPIPWLAPVTMATDLGMCLSNELAGQGVENDDHLSAGLVGLHDTVRLMDLFETEYPDRLDVKATGRSIRSDLLQRHIRDREARSAEREAGEESQVNAARHLQQRDEVGDGGQPAEPAGKTGTAATSQHGDGVEQNAVTYQVQHRIDLLCLGDMFRQIRALDLAALGPQLFQHGEAIAVAGRRDHPGARIHRQL